MCFKQKSKRNKSSEIETNKENHLPGKFPLKFKKHPSALKMQSFEKIKKTNKIQFQKEDIVSFVMHAGKKKNEK